MYADLHIHTIYSDGTDSVQKVFKQAKNAGLELISVTDHDSVSGNREGAELAEKYGIAFVPGIELSAHLNEQVHILGYNFSETKDFLTRLYELKEARKLRLFKMLKKLQNLGIYIDISDIEGFGSLHIARALVKKGIAGTIREAFDRYLRFGAPCYVSEGRLDPFEAVDMIVSAGGLAVLAHPGKMKASSFSEREKLIGNLREKGLSGIEVYYPSHTIEETGYFYQLAGKLGLFRTCGSDYHGEGRPERIGCITQSPDDAALCWLTAKE